MIQRQSSVLDQYDRPVPGAEVYVYDSTTNAAAVLTSDGTTPLTQPVETDEFGVYTYWADTSVYREEIRYGGKLRYREAGIALGSPQPPTEAVATRSVMAAVTGMVSGNARRLSEVGREGVFVFRSTNFAALFGASLATVDPNQGVYVAPATDVTGASGAWVRTGWEELDVRWFGAVADDVTDAYPAFSAAFHLIETLALPGFVNPTLYRGGPALRVPKGKYYSSATFDPLVSFRFIGDGGKGWGAATRIRFPVGVTALRAQAHNTSGASTVDGPHFAGLNIVVQDIYFVGAYNIGAPNEAEAHGCHAKRPIELIRCTFDGFQGDGLYSHATAGGGAPDEGNSNLGRVIDCDFLNNRNGRSIAGSDANAWLFMGCRYDYNRAWAVHDLSFLGNTEVGAHCDSNGIIPGMPSFTMTSQGGSRYSVRDGFAAGASANAPKSSTVTITIASPGVVSWTAHGLPAGTPVTFATTGALPTGLVVNTLYYVLNPGANDFQLAATVGGAAINTSGSQSGVHTSGAATDNTWWLFCYAGGVSAGLIPAWFNGIAVREGGAYHTNNLNASNMFSGCYSESGQGVSQFTYPTMIEGGTQAAGIKGTGVYNRNFQGWARFGSGDLTRGFIADGASTINGPLTVAGTAALGDDLTVNGSSAPRLAFQIAGVAKGAITCSGANLILDGPGDIFFRFTGSNVAAVGPTYVYPTTDNATDLGFSNAAFRWRNVFAMIADLATSLKIAGTKVIGARDTGWTADTGTAKKTATATYTPGSNLTYSAGYVQAEQTATSTRLQLIEPAVRDNSQAIKAIKDALIAHGLLGP